MAERQIRNRKGVKLATVIEEDPEEHAENYFSDSDTEVPVIICCERCCRCRERSKMPVQGCEKCKLDELANLFIHSVCTQREREHIEEKKMLFFDVWRSIVPRRVKAVQDYYAWSENFHTKDIWVFD